MVENVSRDSKANELEWTFLDCRQLVNDFEGHVRVAEDGIQIRSEKKSERPFPLISAERAKVAVENAPKMAESHATLCVTNLMRYIVS